MNHSALHGMLLWLVAIAAIVAGYYLSVAKFLEQEWLSRAGCFIVVLGIWSGVGGIIEERILSRGLRMKKYLAMRRIRMAFGADPEEMKRQMQQVQQQFDNRLEESRKHLGLSVSVIEATLLITGTILWGYGDLIVYLLAGNDGL